MLNYPAFPTSVVALDNFQDASLIGRMIFVSARGQFKVNKG
jgi:hypothetical protein